MWGLTMGTAISLSCVGAFIFSVGGGPIAVSVGCSVVLFLTMLGGMELCKTASVDTSWRGKLLQFLLVNLLLGVFMPVLICAFVVLLAVTSVMDRKKRMPSSLSHFLMAGRV